MNSNNTTTQTHGGAIVNKLTPIQELRRSVLASLLFEDSFYESGKDHADRVKQLVKQCEPSDVMKLAIEAREKMHIRKMPLFLLRELVRHPKKPKIATTLTTIIQRPDEIVEFMKIYWGDGKQPIAKQVKIGLGNAFKKFNEYSLQKYNRQDSDIKLRDVLFMTRPKPENADQELLWKKLVNGELATPDTWETQLSAGADKKETFTRLIQEGKLGYFALLRNLRNMIQSGVDTKLLRDTIVARGRGADQILPYRFLAAAKHAPGMEDALDKAMVAETANRPKLPGKTVIVVDISGSMLSRLSAKSDMSRIDAACALAAVGREMCEDVVVYATAGNDINRIHATGKVQDAHGIALTDAIKRMNHRLGGGGIFLKQVSDYLKKEEGSVDRVFVITDEQDCGSGHQDSPENATLIAPRNYILNVSSYQNGIGYSKWTKITGFSDSVFEYIRAVEAFDDEIESQNQATQKVA
jgi:60 kDa SS-A/Ro ribonucleoprotein